MPDITMCSNETCPIKEKCYRHIAEPSYYQSWAVFDYRNDKCDDYWPTIDIAVKTKKKIKKG